LNDLKESIQALIHSSSSKNTISVQKNAKSTRRLIVMKSQAGYRQCLQHCKSLGIQPAKTIKTLNAILLHVHPKADVGPLRRHVMVQRIESDPIIKLHVFKKKGSHSASSCASLGSPEIIPWGVARVQTPKVWKRTEGDQVRIAVLDTGISSQHPDLRVVGSFNTIKGTDCCKPLMLY
jgi:minor extracellular protease Epr